MKKYLDQNGLVFLWEKIKGTFVKQEAGKGLSTNDFTTTEKDKLAAIKSGATKVEASATNGNIKVDGTETQVYALPTATSTVKGGVSVGSGLSVDSNGLLTNAHTKVSQLTNDSNFQTATQVETAANAARDAAKAYADEQDAAAAAAVAEGYVAKVTGKGLSTNDYTTAEKDKLAAIKEGATKVETSTTNGNIKIDGTESTVYTLPTATTTAKGGVIVGSGLSVDASGKLSNSYTKTSQITNDSDYQTGEQVQAAIEAADYVPTEAGKGLSTNDYTTAEKEKLAGIKTGANVVATSDTNGNIKIDGTEATVYTLPTASATVKGGMTVGTGLSVDANGKVSNAHTKVSDLTNDANYQNADQVQTAIENADYVPTEAGKGLSTNDYTTAEKDKLAAISANAKNVAASDTNGNIKIDNAETVVYTLPTATADVKGGVSVGTGLSVDASGKLSNAITKVSQLSNDSDFQTGAQVTSRIAEAISGVSDFSYLPVEALPETGETGILYLVPNNGSDRNIKDEYIWLGDEYELLGTTEMDLSGYAKYTDIVAITNDEINAICV